jgi:hypothetical protein
MTSETIGGFAGDPAEAFTPPAASGCCGSAPATATATATTCCGTTEAGACCDAVADGAG